MYEWIHDDITWCGNECSHTVCERNVANKLSKTGMYSAALFKDTENCPLYKKKENKIEYVLTMNSDQAHEALKAIELLMRLKLGQYKEIVYSLCDIRNPEFSEDISNADDLLKSAFSIINKDKKPGEYKDTEWYRLYNLYQSLRYAIHKCEHPDTTGVDSYPPIQITEEPVPKCEWKATK